MSVEYFTLTLDPLDNSINDTDLSEGLKQAYIDVFTILVQNPTDVDKSIAVFENYYESLIPAIITSNASTVPISQNNISNKVVQIDMDGNLIAANNQPSFAVSKEQSKNLLGSVEKQKGNEILIADSVNKRAIIIDIPTQKIKWEYNSDRYVVDAHMVLKDQITIKINNSNYVSDDVVVNKGQMAIWENNMNFPIVIYSGDISGVDVNVNFDIDSYGDTFKSIVLNEGERWSFTFNNEGEMPWFSYPNIYSGKIIVSDYKISSANQYILIESDSLESPFTSSAIKIDCWGNILWKLDNLVNPKDVRSLLDNKTLISI
jgi:hypothetical protein